MANCPACGRWNDTPDGRLTNAASMFDHADYCFSHEKECYGYDKKENFEKEKKALTKLLEGMGAKLHPDYGKNRTF
jgi:hypothetical protein